MATPRIETLIPNWNLAILGGGVLLAGLFIGTVGFYSFSIFKAPVPEYLRLGHAILSFWSVLLILLSFILGNRNFGGMSQYFPPALAVAPVAAAGLLVAWGIGFGFVSVFLLAVVVGVWMIMLLLTTGFSISKDEPLGHFSLYLRLGWMVMLFSLALGIFMAAAFTLRGVRPPLGLITAHTHSFLYVLLMLGSILILRLAGATGRLSRIATHFYLIGAIGNPIVVTFFALDGSLRTISLPFDFLVFIAILLVLLALLGVESNRERLREMGVSRGLLVFSFAMILVTTAWGGLLVLLYKPGMASEYVLPRSPIVPLETLHFSPLAFAAVSMAIALLLQALPLSPGLKMFIATLLATGTALNFVGVAFTLAGFPPGALQVKVLGGIPLFGLGVILFFYSIARSKHLARTGSIC